MPSQYARNERGDLHVTVEDYPLERTSERRKSIFYARRLYQIIFLQFRHVFTISCLQPFRITVLLADI